MKLSEQDIHNLAHARYLVEQATDEKPEVCFDFTLVRSVLAVIARATDEIEQQISDEVDWIDARLEGR